MVPNEGETRHKKKSCQEGGKGREMLAMRAHRHLNCQWQGQRLRLRKTVDLLCWLWMDRGGGISRGLD